MLRVPTALLLHRTPTGCHHDWLVGTPEYRSDPDSGLWTARVGPASRDWRELGHFDMTQLPPHRRAYLDYQGPISDGRGTVVRIDRGSAVIRLWSHDRIVWDVQMCHYTGLIDAKRLNEQVWRAEAVF
jgi:hypothetical protein